MPPIDKEFATDDPFHLKLICYGSERRKKTWWACNAAKAGFNVILLDCDKGAHIVKQIAPAAWHRILHVDITDKMSRPVACEFITRFMRAKPFIWDEQSKSVSLIKGTRNTAHSFLDCDPSRLTSNDIVIVDSWTRLAWSLMRRWFDENGIDISEAQQAKDKDWGVYRWGSAISNFIIAQLMALPCHVIIIGHQTVHEKYNTEKVNGKNVRTLESSKLQFVSTSHNHAGSMASNFDILYFELVGAEFIIDTTPSNGRVSGSRLMKPGRHKWNELQFADICKLVGIAVPNDAPAQTALEYIPPGIPVESNSNLSISEEADPPKIVDATGIAKAKFSGLLKQGTE